MSATHIAVYDILAAEASGDWKRARALRRKARRTLKREREHGQLQPAR